MKLLSPSGRPRTFTYRHHVSGLLVIHLLMHSVSISCVVGSSNEVQKVMVNDAAKKQKAVHSSDQPRNVNKQMKIPECTLGNVAKCEKDRLGIEAIMSLHIMLDDDHNGNVDQSESDEFLRDELQYTDGFERQALFHNNDKLISLDDLWKAWQHSKVYNWTVDDVIEWLVHDVDLPQYSHVFHRHHVDGSVLPRLVNATSPLLQILGIRNPVHKQKLSLKAMDTVLFGAPKRINSYVKDLLLISSLIIAIGGCWFACLHHRYSQTQVKKMMKDLESLQKAEDALRKLSKELADAEKNQNSVPQDKQEELRILRQNSIRLKVPARLSSGDTSPSPLSREGSMHRRQEGERKLQQAEEELASLREALTEAENKLEIHQQLESQWSVPGELQAWLQLTHELEQTHYNAKRQAAERQLLMARDGCDKIKKRNKAFLGSLRMAHSNSLDDIDQSILDARAALEDVKHDLQERLHRWHTIELLCGFPIISNSGLTALKQALGRDTSSSGSGRVLAPMSIDEADEDLPSVASYPQANLVNSTSKTFLKQQGLAGSTNSLSHPGSNSTSGHSTLMVNPHTHQLMRQESHELDTVGFNPGGTVAFHLGDNLNLGSSGGHHERTLSNTSTTQISPSHNGASGTHSTPRNFRSSLSHPSYHQHSNGQSIAQSSGNASLSHSQSLTLSSSTLGAGLSSKLYNSPPGNHLSVGTTTPDSGHHGAQQHHHFLENGVVEESSPDDNNNPELLSASTPNAHRVGSSQGYSMGVPIHHPTSLHLEDSDANSMDFMPRNHSAIMRARLDRSPELDLSSLETDSMYSSRGATTPLASGAHKKQGKKKKFLPNFLQKNKNKQKSS